MTRCREQPGGRCSLDHMAGMHHHHPIAEIGGQREVMGNQKRGDLIGPRTLPNQVQHRRLGGHIEAGGRLVADQQPGRCRHCQRDHHPLTHAARQLEGIGMPALLRIGDRDLAQARNRPLAQILTADRTMAAQHVFELATDLTNRVERRARVLKDHADLAPAQVLQFTFARRQKIDAIEVHRAAGDAGSPIGQPEQRMAQHRFARARLAHQPDNLAAADRQAHMIERPHRAAARAELERQIVDRQHRPRDC